MSNLVKRMDLRGAKATLAAMLWMPRAFQPHPEPRAVPSARPASSHRGIRLALLALALGGMLLWSAPAGAQTVTTFVKNTGQTADGFAQTFSFTFSSHAVTFTTGSNATGYPLDSIGINFSNIADTSTAADALTVTLNADNSGVPGDALCTLNDPATFTASGVHKFSAPTTGTDLCPTLAASTTYFVVMTSSSFTTAITLPVTTTSDEDSGAAAGWSIGHSRYVLNAGMWSNNSSQAYLIEVNGTAPAATPGVTISESTLDVTEGGATDTYTVVLDTAPTGDVTIAVTETSDDISLSATTLTFGTANWSVAQAVTVTAVDDSSTEAEETVTITHSVSASADTTDYPTTLTVDSVDVTVTDNDAATPGVTVSESTIAVTEGGATDTYTVVLDTAPTGDVTIAVTETSPDISLSATTLTFGTANWSNAQTVTVTAVDDSSTEAEETVTITHSVSASADTTDYPTSLSVDSVDVTVTDNDAVTPGVTVSKTSVTVSEAAGTETYTIELDSQPTGTVSIAVASDATSNATVSPSSLSFSTSDWNSAKTVTVTGVNDDTLNASNRTATITHTVSGADYGSVTADSVDVSVTDDEIADATLVKNTGQTDNGVGSILNSSVPGGAQQFITGPNAAGYDGYTVSSIGISFHTIADTSTAGSELTASLYDSVVTPLYGLAPNSALCTLEDPGSFSSSGVQTFSAPTTGTNLCPTLAANTRYFVVVTRANTNAGTIRLDITTSTSEDSGAAAGWLLSSDAWFLDGSTWTIDTGVVGMVDVRGEAVPATPGVTVSESAIAVTEGGTTDTYTVVLDTAPTGDVTIAVTEASDDISLSATTLTFGTANWSNAQTVTVTAVDDSITEDEETVTISHSVSASADTTDYPTTLTVDSVSVTVSDNDASAPGAPVLTAAAKNESIELTWTIADPGSSDITRFEYRIKETTGGTYPATWTDTGAAASNTGGSATIGSLTNATQYTVQVRGVSSDGEGAASNEPTATPQAPPAVTAIAITSTPATANTYIIGEEIEFTVTFDKDLTLGGTDTTKDPGYITFQTDYAADTSGQDSPEADCEIGANTKTIVCTEPVREGWYDTDGISVFVNALDDQGQISHFAGPLGQRANLDHAALPVDANHKIDGVKPTLSSANASGDLTKVVLTFSEAIGTVDNTEITVKKGGTDQTTTGAVIDSTNSTKVEITLMTAFLSTDTNITVELTADAVKDVPGNGIDAVSSTAVSLVDNTAPTLVSATVETFDGVNGTSLRPVFDESLDLASIPGVSAFTVKVEGNSRTLTSVTTTVVRDTWLSLNFAMADWISPGETVTVSYAKPGTNPLKDAANNEVESFTDFAVTNNLPATAPEAVASLTASNTSTFGEVDLQWDGDTWANGSAITRHEVRYLTPIWSATLTVKEFGTNNLLGCDSARTNLGCEPSELLTDSTFSYDSVDYLIGELYLTTGGQLFLATNKSSITAAALADLSLNVGDLSFPFADATHSLGNLTWSSTGLSWSEDDMVPLAIRTDSSPWTEVPDSAPGEANETSHTLEGLDPGGEYTFEVRAVNDVGGGGEASDTLTLLAPAWSFTLRDSGGNDITELTEGGDPATATVSLTGSVRFRTEQTVQLKWGTLDLRSGLIVGDGGTSTITIPAGQSSGSLEISSPDGIVESYRPPITLALTATHGGTQIGSIDLTWMDDESVPVATISQEPTTVNEGESIEIEISLTLAIEGSSSQRTINFAVTDADSVLSGTVPTNQRFSSGETTQTVTLTTADNTTQNDGARDVTFTLALNADALYTLGEPSSVTVTVRDNDTPPTAPQNLMAQAGDTEARLTWQPPLPPVPDHGQRVSYYQYRVKAGTDSFGNWTMVPDSGPNDTGHTFTGLTNGTQYTYEVRAVNIAGGGAEASTTVTPIEGVAVSFAVATLSVDEGETVTVTVTLATAPAASVTVLITATPGEGLGTGRVLGRADERGVQRGRDLEELHGRHGG